MHTDGSDICSDLGRDLRVVVSVKFALIVVAFVLVLIGLEFLWIFCMGDI